MKIGKKGIIWKTALPPDIHVFLRAGTTLKPDLDGIRTSVLKDIHDDCAQTMTCIMFTRFHYSHIKKLPVFLVAMFFKLKLHKFKLNCDINRTNVLRKFHDGLAKSVTSNQLHEDWAINVTSGVFTI
ncbi:hypothetical protein DPMN_031399 [Dreissena polymorpha]|uniref:Uncharacterized protein n=1 Tax=Dreissena polymorpha TaxID=45954 RepID=A0A9D4RI08_DREPO|nr:hypothetical protein DPMN_031399 [Dreissena polymorpha]